MFKAGQRLLFLRYDNSITKALICNEWYEYEQSCLEFHCPKLKQRSPQYDIRAVQFRQFARHVARHLVQNDKCNCNDGSFLAKSSWQEHWGRPKNAHSYERGRLWKPCWRLSWLKSPINRGSPCREVSVFVRRWTLFDWLSERAIEPEQKVTQSWGIPGKVYATKRRQRKATGAYDWRRVCHNEWIRWNILKNRP